MRWAVRGLLVLLAVLLGAAEGRVSGWFGGMFMLLWGITGAVILAIWSEVLLGVPYRAALMVAPTLRPAEVRALEEQIADAKDERKAAREGVAAARKRLAELRLPDRSGEPRASDGRVSLAEGGGELSPVDEPGALSVAAQEPEGQ